jgi:hypothetical protein
MDYLKDYNLLKSQKYISNQDFQVRVVHNIFSKNQIDHIYNIVDNTPEENTHLQTWAGHRAWNVTFGPEIEKTITNAAQSILGDNVELIHDYSFARYSPEYGYECKLFPHYDTREYQRITFDIQLNASEPWGIVVENDTYYLENNQALVFAGTQQMHWRENIKIKPDSKIDMIFCHLQHKPIRLLDDGQKDILEERSRFLMEKTGISNEAISYSV